MKNLKLALALSTTLFTSSVLADTSNFRFVEDIDVMTDEDKSIVVSLSTQKTGAFIWFSCEPRGLRLGVFFNEYLGMEANPLHYRLDSEQVTTTPATIATNGKAMFTYNSTLISSLKNHERVIFRTADFRNVPHLVLVSLTGLEENLQKLNCYN
jgi:hypothetical protein